MATFRDYLTLIRFPNLFTVPSNVAAGFAQLFTLSQIGKWDLSNLIVLMLTSILVYIVGVILNDYFDIKIDKTERPSRPLPSKRISTRSAITFAFMATLVAILFSAAISIFSLAIISLILVAIFVYDYSFKNSVFSSFTMATCRVLNIVLGFSQGIFRIIEDYDTLIRVIVILVSMFMYVVAITNLSRYESGSQNRKVHLDFNFSLVLFIPLIIGIFTVIGFFKLDLFVNLAFFVGMIFLTFLNVYSRHDQPDIKKIVRNLILSIIILDSIFISGTVGLEYGLIAMLLLIPAIIFSRKFYVT